MGENSQILSVHYRKSHKKMSGENMLNIIGLPERFEPDAVQHDPDTLASAFLKTEAYRQANSVTTSILYLVGNKGAGKSAIINKIYKERSPRAIIFYYKNWFSKIENRVEIEFKANPESQLHLLYESEWRTVLWVEIVKSLYEEYRRKRKWWQSFDTSAYLDLFNYLVDNNLPVEIPFVSKFYYSLRRVREVSVGGSGGKIDPSQPSESFNALAFNKIIGAIAQIVADNPFFLLIDEMDKVDRWNPNTRASLLGLIEAAESIIRDFSVKSESKHGLLIRIAIRSDMLTAATDGFVNTQILNKISIDPTWKQDELEELVAQQIRDHWKLPSGAVSRRKILSEVLPPYVIKDNQPFRYLSTLSHNNPRSLYTLIKSALEKSIEKSNAYAPLSIYPPSSITMKHLREVLDVYLQGQLKFKIDGSTFLFPGLSKFINEFIKNLGELFFSNKDVETDKLVKEISKYISNKKGLKSQVEKWTIGGYTDTDNVLRVLYEINLVGFKKQSKPVFYPAMFKKSDTITVDPIFYATIFENTLQGVKDNPIKRLEFAKNNLILSISNLTKEVGSTSSRIIDENESQVQSVEYNQPNILYEIIRLIWSIRQLEKLLTGYGSELDISLVKNVPNILGALKIAMEQLSICFETDIRNLYTLSILSNLDDGTFSADKIEFEREMEKEENVLVYENCKGEVFNWIKMLGQEEHSDLPDKLQDVLVPLRDVASKILLDSNVLLT